MDVQTGYRYFKILWKQIMKYREKYFWELFLGVLIATVAVISSSNAQSIYNQKNKQKKLQTGDGVRIMIWQDIGLDNPSGLRNLGIADDYLVDGTGNILIPAIGQVKVSGYTPIALSQIIQSKLAIKTIHVICMPLVRVTVLGAVNKPGSYLIEPDDSLWELINEAGGPANNVDIEKIRVERGGHTVIENLLQGFEKAHSLEQLGIQSGDQILLPAVSKVRMSEILRYVSFGMSAAIFYLQITGNK